MGVLGPMHPCLNLDEIIRDTACELIISKAGATAVAFASCCKSFEDPVLDTLWGAQTDLLPALMTFPIDIWNWTGQGLYEVSASTTAAFPSLSCVV